MVKLIKGLRHAAGGVPDAEPSEDTCVGGGRHTPDLCDARAQRPRPGVGNMIHTNCDRCGYPITVVLTREDVEWWIEDD